MKEVLDAIHLEALFRAAGMLDPEDDLLCIRLEPFKHRRGARARHSCWCCVYSREEFCRWYLRDPKVVTFGVQALIFHANLNKLVS